MKRILIPLLQKIEDLARSGTRYKIAEGGRGSGKSYGLGCVFVAYGLMERARFLCTRETQNSLSDSTLAIMKRVIRDNDLTKYFYPTKHGLSTVNGSEYIFRGLQNPDRIKSLDDIKYCWVAEAQRVTDDAFDMLIPTIRADGSQIWIDFNPDHPEDPVARRFTEVERADVTKVHMTHVDNHFFPEVLKAEMAYDYEVSPERAEWIWGGQYRTISEALVFRSKYSVREFKTPKDAQFYHGVDWGFSADPTVLVRCYIVDRDLYIDAEAWALHCELDDIPTLFETVSSSRRWKLLADDSRPETISHIKNKGFKISGAPKGKGSVEDGIEFIKSFRSIIIHPRCPHVVDEFKTYSYIRDRLTGDPTPNLEDKNNHCIDALRYALTGVRRTPKGTQGGAGLDVM